VSDSFDRWNRAFAALNDAPTIYSVERSVDPTRLAGMRLVGPDGKDWPPNTVTLTNPEDAVTFEPGRPIPLEDLGLESLPASLSGTMTVTSIDRDVGTITVSQGPGPGGPSGDYLYREWQPPAPNRKERRAARSRARGVR
jgi:hypothetical protein